MDRNRLLQHAKDWIERLGSQSAVARKVGINNGALSTWLAGKYGAKTDSLDAKIAAALDFKQKAWVTVETVTNYRQIKLVFDNAQNENLWFAISNKAGSGKTETLEHIYNNDKSGNVLFINAESWTARQFLTKLAEKLEGPVQGSGYKSVAQLTDIVVAYINGLNSPVLMIDNADKLRPSALRCLIPIYDRTRYKLGVILCGTENLEKEIKHGVAKNWKGYDEIDSRLGRSYIHLMGASRADVVAMLQANGIQDNDTIEYIWNNLEKVKKPVKKMKKAEIIEAHDWFVEDFRRIERMIKTEKLIKNVEIAA